MRIPNFVGVGLLLAAVSIQPTAGGWDASTLIADSESPTQYFPDTAVVALVRAAKTGDVVKMKALIRQGVDVNYSGKDGVTPLVWVMGEDDRTAATALLKLGADPNKKIDNGNSPTWLAAGRDDPKMLELVLGHHGDPNITNSRGITALEEAVRQFRTTNIDILIKAGANLNYANRFGESAATYAASLGRFDVVEHLLDEGYSTDLQKLAGWIQARHVPPNSQQQQWKNRVIEMLKARGARYPVPRSTSQFRPTPP